MGSPNVLVNGQQLMRIGDPGLHAACCGPNTWKVASGSKSVKVNGIAPSRLGDDTSHCGGSGKVIEGSPDVMIGDKEPKPPPPVATKEIEPEQRQVTVNVATDFGHTVGGAEVLLTLASGAKLTAKTDDEGQATFEDVPPNEEGTVEFSDPEDAQARSVAADLGAAVEQQDFGLAQRCLQYATDFQKVAAAYSEHPGGDLAGDLKGAFPAEDDLDVIEFLLEQAGLE